MKFLKLRKYAMLFACALIISFSFVCILKKSTTGKTVSNKIEKLTKNELVEEGNKKTVLEKTVFVDVKGNVKSPGVYKLSNEKIVMDAINSAGGLEDNADTTYINLSKKLVDEMVIYIFSKEEVINLIKNNEITNEIGETIGGVLNNDSYIESNTKENIKNNNENNNLSKSNNNASNKSSESTNKNNEIKADKNTIININTASKEELMDLSGIGESKAQNIINYRVDNGEFKSIEDIKNVKGIGDSIFEKIKNDICI